MARGPHLPPPNKETRQYSTVEWHHSHHSRFFHHLQTHHRQNDTSSSTYPIKHGTLMYIVYPQHQLTLFHLFILLLTCYIFGCHLSTMKTSLHSSEAMRRKALVKSCAQDVTPMSNMALTTHRSPFIDIKMVNRVKSASQVSSCSASCAFIFIF